MSTSLLNLPAHLALNIFERLDEKDLLRSRSVSRRWKSLVDDDALWLKKFLKLDRYSPHWIDSKVYSWKNRYFYSKQWIRGRVDRSVCLNLKKKYIPWLQLDPSHPHDHVWVSRGCRIDRHSRSDMLTGRESPPQKRHRHAQSPSLIGLIEGDDFCRFVVCRESSASDSSVIAAGTRGGWIYLYRQSSASDRSHDRIDYFLAHQSDVHCVDIVPDQQLLISGSRDRTVKIWRIDDQQGVGDQQREMMAQLDLGDRAWCLKSRNGSIAVGSAACWNECAPLTLWDLNSARITARLGVPCKRGAGILDLSFTSDNTILSGGYDSVVRLWDLRASSRQCVWSWEETYNSSIYCLDSDRYNSMFVGTSRYGLVWLLDMRWKNAIQNFYVGNQSVPVYSMAASTETLYVGLDKEVWSLRCNQPRTEGTSARALVR